MSVLVGFKKNKNRNFFSLTAEDFTVKGYHRRDLNIYVLFKSQLLLSTKTPSETEASLIKQFTDRQLLWKHYQNIGFTPSKFCKLETLFTTISLKRRTARLHLQKL
jgi:hypothetical protein